MPLPEESRLEIGELRPSGESATVIAGAMPLSKHHERGSKRQYIVAMLTNVDMGVASGVQVHRALIDTCRTILHCDDSPKVAISDSRAA